MDLGRRGAWKGGRLAALREGLTGALWPLPSLAVLLAIGLGALLTRVPLFVDSSVVFGGGPDAAREVLSAVASSLITVTSLTFSLTVVTLQLASSQFSNRLLRTFVRDRLVQATLALFLGTFAYALTVLRTVRSDADVPQLAVTIGFLLALASVLGLVVFLSHLVTLLRVESMLRDVHADAAASAQRLPSREEAGDQADVPEPPPDAVPLIATRSGFVVTIDGQRLHLAAERGGAVVLVDRAPGDPIVRGTPFALAWPLPGEDLADPESLAEDAFIAVATGHERTLTQDPAFGLRQLVDVAAKALSPGVNDPTTAIHAIGHLSGLLCLLASKDLRPLVSTDDAGRVRTVVRRRGFKELMELSCGEVRRYGASEPTVSARLLRLLREVAWCARDDEQRGAVQKQLARLKAAIDRDVEDEGARAHLERLHRHVEDALEGRWTASVASSG